MTHLFVRSSRHVPIQGALGDDFRQFQRIVVPGGIGATCGLNALPHLPQQVVAPLCLLQIAADPKSRLFPLACRIPVPADATIVWTIAARFSRLS
jgi:hypothetical protein